MNFVDEYDKLLNSKSRDAWFIELQRQANRLGFKDVLFGIKRSRLCEIKSAEIISNYCPIWRRKYDTEQYALIDPMVTKSFAQVSPIMWSPSEYRTTEQKEFHEDASSFGYNCGATLPLHGPKGEIGTLSFSMGEQSATEASWQHIKANLAELSLVRDLSLSSFLCLTDNPGGCRI